MIHDNDHLLSIAEAAKVLGVNPETLRRWDNDGTLPAIKINDRGDRRWRKTDLLVFAQNKVTGFVTEHAGYEVTLLDGAFRSFTDRFGVIGKYVLTGHGVTVGVVFACAGLEVLGRQIGEKELRNMAEDNIREIIDDRQLLDGETYTFEFRNGDFQRVFFPEWWDEPKSIVLTDGLRIKLKAVHQVAEGVEAWRCIVQFESKDGLQWYPVRIGHTDKYEYFVWVTAEYLEDKAKLSPNISGAEIFALDHARNRFNQTADESGYRSLFEIGENQVACWKGRCRLGESLPIEDLKNG